MNYVSPQIQKSRYGGQILGAYVPKQQQSVATQPKVSKNRPDTSFEHGESRWFTTTGIEGTKARSSVILQPENRITTTREYFKMLLIEKKERVLINLDILDNLINNN